MRGTKNFSMEYINGIQIMVAPKICYHPNMGSLFPHGKHYGRGVWAEGSVFHTY